HRSATAAGSTGPVVRSAKSRSASEPSGSGPTATTRSPGTASRSRLVASTVTVGHAASSRSTKPAAASTTCSQLSRTSRQRPRASRPAIAASSGCWGPSATPSAAATACGTESSRAGTRSTNAPPNGNAAASTTTTASRVLPTPPGPVSVTSRCSASAASTSSRSAARPTNDVRATGRPTTPPGGGASPASGPTSAASSLRSATPYLRSSDETWPSTVRTDRCRRRAIWALDSCAPTAASTSASRPVTSTGWGTGPSWPNSRWRWPPPALVTGGHRGLPRSGAGPRAVHHGLHDPDDEGAPMTVPSLPKSAELNARLHAVVPGGAHTYAKGDDQYPQDLAPIISHGRGAHVWDVDGNQYIEYGSGLRAVSLGHAHPRILDAVRRELDKGSNFVRP